MHVDSLDTDRGAGALNGQFAGGQQSVSAGLFGGRNDEVILESVAFAQKNSA